MDAKLIKTVTIISKKFANMSIKYSIQYRYNVKNKK